MSVLIQIFFGVTSVNDAQWLLVDAGFVVVVMSGIALNLLLSD